MHGYQWIDNYSWMKDVPRDKPETIAYVEAENAYTDSMLSDTEEMQERLFEEIKSRIKETDIRVPVKRDEYFYYSRTEEGKDYPILCRKRGDLDAEEEVTLDINLLAEGREFYSVGFTSYSPDHRFLAFSFDTTGSERYTLQIKDLETGALLSDHVYPLYQVAWANDNNTLFYVRVEDPDVESPLQLFRHVMGTLQDDDLLVYEEEDLAYGISIGKTRSKQFLLLAIGTTETNEYRYLSADDPFGEFRTIKPREEGVEYQPSHWDDTFFIVTNIDEAKNFKVMRAPVDAPESENWTEYIAHRDSVYITGFDVFQDWIAIHERKDGLEKIRVIHMPSGKEHYVTFPEPTYSFYSGENPNYDQNTYRITYASLITPQTVYDYHFDTRELEVMKRREVLGGYEPTEYNSERLYAEMRDGTLVPISLVYRKDNFLKDGSNPLYLYAYGSYGYGMNASFASSRLSLLDRGFAYAIAHIRGGDELGEDWHDQGKVLTKRNTFNDFIDCAEFLIRENYTREDRLVINGASAGGMLMGVVANWRPDLFAVVVAEVPAVDELHHMLDPSLPGVEYHYGEWGDPNVEEEFEYFRSWDAYQNIKAQDYPPILVTAGLHDPRVPYWEPVKYVAKMRTHKTDDNLLLLKTKMSGHMGASGRYDFYREIAFEFAFIFHCLGIEP
jgi:oligopeptidase B